MWIITFFTAMFVSQFSNRKIINIMVWTELLDRTDDSSHVCSWRRIFVLTLTLSRMLNNVLKKEFNHLSWTEYQLSDCLFIPQSKPPWNAKVWPIRENRLRWTWTSFYSVSGFDKLFFFNQVKKYELQSRPSYNH